MKLIYSVVIFLFFSSGTYASTITGHVFDKKNNEQLVGATIVLHPGSISAVSRLDGKYTFEKIKAGSYKLTVSYIGYALLIPLFR